MIECEVLFIEERGREGTETDAHADDCVGIQEKERVFPPPVQPEERDRQCSWSSGYWGRYGR